MRSLIRRDHHSNTGSQSGAEEPRSSSASPAQPAGPGSNPYPPRPGGPTVGGKPVEGSARPSWLQPEGGPEPSSSSPAGQSTGEQAPAPASTPAAPPAEDRRSTENTLIVGPNIKLKGEIAACDTLVVEGTIEAEMDSHHIAIAKGGVFSGKVTVDTAEVAGSFDGNLTVRDRLLVRSTGRISGTVRYGALEVENGGRLAGTLDLLDDGDRKPATAGGGASSSSSSSPVSPLKTTEPKAKPDDKESTPPAATGT
ncbi:polymer-forming cytoskeletal protein [Caenispirillum salinarum]|uniref:bactofilin family protein n=1 Tax=Caenispirillum salinarum TaxID=859058 RepID=UPI00384BAB6B